MNFVPPSDIFLGLIRIHLYGMMIALAVLVGWYVAFRFVGRFGQSKKYLDQSIFWVLIPGFVGARIFFVAFQWQYFSQNLDRIIAFWDGGMAIYGGLIGGVVGLYVFSRVKKVSFLSFLDIFALVAPLGQAIGRWGNYFNQEAFGTPTTLPWGIYIEEVFRPNAFKSFEYFHPTFLYESLWNVVVFFILLGFTKNKEIKPGTVAAYYLLLYAPARFFIEALRTDSLYFGSLRISQVVSIAAVLVGSYILVTINKKEKNANS